MAFKPYTLGEEFKYKDLLGNEIKNTSAAGKFLGSSFLGMNAADALSTFSKPIGGLLSLGMTSKPGAILGTAGDLVSKIPGPVGVFGGAALNIGSGIVNSLFGYKENTENIEAAKAGNNQLLSFQSNAGSFDEVQNAPSIAGFKKSDLGKEGIWSDHITKIFNNLRDERLFAQDFALRSIGNNIFKLNKDQFRNSLFNYLAFGGEITNGALFDTDLVSIDNGGTHEQNPNQGVLIGVDPQGTPNLVEEGEVVWDNQYVFSNRIKAPLELRGKYGMKHNKNATFADVAKKIKKRREERPNDPITLRSTEAELIEAKNYLEYIKQMQLMQQLMQEAAAQELTQQQYALAAPMQDEQMLQELMEPQMMAYGGNLYATGSGMDTVDVSETVEPGEGMDYTYVPGFENIRRPYSDVDLSRWFRSGLIDQSTYNMYLPHAMTTPTHTTDPLVTGMTVNGKTWKPKGYNDKVIKAPPTPNILKSVPAKGLLSNEELDKLKSQKSSPKGVFLTPSEKAAFLAPAIEAGVNAFTDAMGWTNRPDLGKARMLRDASTVLQPMKSSPIYQEFKPYYVDPFIGMSNNNALLAASNRALANSGNNYRGALMANNFRGINTSGEALEKALLFNAGQNQAASEFRLKRDTANAENILKTNQINANINALRYAAAKDYAEAVDAASTLASQIRAANRGKFANSLRDWALSSFNARMANAMLAAYPTLLKDQSLG